MTVTASEPKEPDPKQTISANNAVVLWLLTHTARFVVPVLLILTGVTGQKWESGSLSHPQNSVAKVSYPEMCGVETGEG